VARPQVVPHREARRVEHVPLPGGGRLRRGEAVAQLGVDGELADPPPIAGGALVVEVGDQVHPRHGGGGHEAHVRLAHDDEVLRQRSGGEVDAAGALRIGHAARVAREGRAVLTARRLGLELSAARREEAQRSGLAGPAVGGEDLVAVPAARLGERASDMKTSTLGPVSTARPASHLSNHACRA
jgi:hypothetical protein